MRRENETISSTTNRIRFASAKKRSSLASANVYRPSQRDSSMPHTVREKRVHHHVGDIHDRESAISSKNQRVRNNDSDHSNHNENDGVGERTALIRSRNSFTIDSEKKENHQGRSLSSSSTTELLLNGNESFSCAEMGVIDYPDDDHEFTKSTTSFASELDVALERNNSEVFVAFHRAVWPLVRSLPELLHNAQEVMQALLTYVLGDNIAAYANKDKEASAIAPSSSGNHQIVNLATLDLLHLIAVIARDLRHEIHPFVFTQILPRLLGDVLNSQSKTSTASLDVDIVETTFRTIAYVLRYDSGILLRTEKYFVLSTQPDHTAHGRSPAAEEHNEKRTTNGVEQLRAFYGLTLGHKSELVRRLAAETFAPLIRKLSVKNMKRHVKRVLRALVANYSSHDETKNVMNNSASVESSQRERLERDTNDGIAKLLWYIAKGVRGRLNLKNGFEVFEVLVECLQSSSSTSDGGQYVIARVSSSFLIDACRHLDSSRSFLKILQVLINYTTFSLKQFEEHKDICISSLGCLLELIQQVVSYCNGDALQKGLEGDVDEKRIVDNLVDLLARLMDDRSNRLLDSLEYQSKAFRFICSFWIALPNYPYLVTSIRSRLGRALLWRSSNSDSDWFLSLSEIVVNELLIPLPDTQVTMSIVASALLSAAAGLAASSVVHARSLVLSVVLSTRKRLQNDIECAEDSDLFFDLAYARFVSVTESEQNRLILAFCCRNTTCVGTMESCIDFAERALCISFCALVTTPHIEVNAIVNHRQSYELALESLLLLSGTISEANEYKISDSLVDKPLSERLSVLLSITLECASALLVNMFSISELGSPQFVRIYHRSLLKLQGLVEQHLLHRSNSPSSVKCASIWVQFLNVVDQRNFIGVSSNALFEYLVPNLCHKNHFVRLHSVRVLAFLPPEPYVSNDESMDGTGDLNQKPSYNLHQLGSSDSSMNLRGMSELPSLLLSLESTNLSLTEERHLLTQIGRVGVLGNSSQLPLHHAEAAASHLLGILHCKFAPVWPAAINVLVTLAKNYESVVWPLIERKLKILMGSGNDDTPKSTDYSSSSSTHFFCQYMAWDRCGDQNLFQKDIENAKIQGRVSRHDSSDELKVFESMWAILEMTPWIVCNHSRTVVDLFVRFMYEQYFGLNKTDHDARELHLAKHIGAERYSLHNSSDCVKSTEKWKIQKRLVAILKTFAAIKRPQHFSQSSLLKSIFTSLLGHSEASLSQLAFACLLRFNDPHLLPYSESIEKLFAKGKLREGLLQLKSLAESHSIVTSHRQMLLPTVSRILFGRLSSKAVNKTTKDSPVARRAAIISFLNCFCIEDYQLDFFVRLMLRAYVPRGCTMDCVEKLDASEVTGTSWEYIESIKPDGVILMSPTIHKGFLNLLGAILDQIGFRVAKHIPSFVSIILAIAQAYEIKKMNFEDDEELTDDYFERSGESADISASFHSSTVRALCYNRIADIMIRFHDSIDFSRISESLWVAMRSSVPYLPEMAVNSSHAPSLLRCVVSLSTQAVYVPFLEEHADITPAVLKCITPQSTSSVVSVVLSFVDNLIGAKDESDGTSPKLVQQNVRLLLSQFETRLGLSSPVSMEDDGPRKQHSTVQCTWKQELRILSRVSKLLLDNLIIDSVDIQLIDSICRVIFPFLERRWISEAEQLHVLSILHYFAPRTGLSFATEMYSRLSILLGLGHKSKPRIESKEMRKSIASVLQSLSLVVYGCSNSSNLSVALCAIHLNRVDELDYDKVLPALGKLGERDQVLSLCSTGDSSDPSMLLPLIHQCFSFLNDSDGVTVRSSANALKNFVTVCANESRLDLDDSQLANVDENIPKWRKLLQGTLVSVTREGLQVKDDTIRRFFVLLTREVVIQCRLSSSPHLHKDLLSLVNEGEPDMDFFLNITHVQIHRRSRALQRLRKALNDVVPPDVPQLSLPSLSNVLLPLALHSIYESKTKADENLALEAIATVGAISKFLSFSKYNALLSTTLSQFHRNEDHERYIIALLCSVIDSFHYETNYVQPLGSTSGVIGTSPVHRALVSRIIPKAENLLIKERVDRHGVKSKILRPSIVLALHKLFQKMSGATFRSKLPRLLSVICDILKSRESNIRDMARATLAKMVVSMDLIYLPDVVRELALSLREGYRLHVRTATIHSILTELSNATIPSENDLVNAFDLAVPGLMDLLQQDLFGDAQERKDASDSQVSFVKEAGGSKSLHSLELIALMISFNPRQSHVHPRQCSTVHSLVSPLLQRLRDANIDLKTIRKIRECLSRVISGFSRNQSVSLEEVLKFTYATISPYLLKLDNENDLDEVSDEEEKEALSSIVVSGGPVVSDLMTLNAKSQVVEWRPSMLNVLRNTKEAHMVKNISEHQDSKVSDGASAPKLTGSNRLQVNVRNEVSICNPSCVAALVFGLQMLLFSVKKFSGSTNEIQNKLDPFVPLLSTCLCDSKEMDIVVLSIKVLGIFFREDLPSLSRYAQAVASKCLDLLTSSGSSSNKHKEIIQTCFKMLSILFDYDHRFSSSPKQRASYDGPSLTQDQMDVLLTFLRVSIMDSEQAIAAMNLVKSIVKSMFQSVALYDLMEVLLEHSVRNSNPALRQQCSMVFVSYMLNYPLSSDRIEVHLKQIILNLKYEFSEGRLAAVSLLSTIIDKASSPVVDTHSKLFFMPLTMQLVNDDTEECRKMSATAIENLVKRLSYSCQVLICDYVILWSQGDDEGLQRTGLQLYGVLLEACPETIKRRNLCQILIDNVQTSIGSNDEQCNTWEITYFALSFVEKAKKLPFFTSVFEQHYDLWESVTRCLYSNHPWIRLLAVRILSQELISIPSIDATSSMKTLARTSSSLYKLARGMSYQLGLDEKDQNEEVTTLSIKSLTWIVPAMHRARDSHLLVDTQAGTSLNQEVGVDKDELNESRDLVVRVLRQLSNMAKHKGSKRRIAIFKCFASLASTSSECIIPYLEIVLEPLHRCELESQNVLQSPSALFKVASHRETSHPHHPNVSEESQFAQNALQLLEDISPDAFLRSYAVTKSRAKEKKDLRKQTVKTLAVRDPSASALLRVQKQEREKSRRKRRIEEKRRDCGGNVKRRFGVS